MIDADDKTDVGDGNNNNDDNNMRIATPEIMFQVLWDWLYKTDLLLLSDPDDEVRYCHTITKPFFYQFATSVHASVTQ